ncbi:hypothetical protein Misp03_57700 [Microbispora sp. NBRC 16548]|nr:hypothetical protein Misp03_57700 [Microbispora sp. NBRC 16548]
MRLRPPPCLPLGPPPCLPLGTGTADWPDVRGRAAGWDLRAFGRRRRAGAPDMECVSINASCEFPEYKYGQDRPVLPGGIQTCGGPSTMHRDRAQINQARRRERIPPD